MATAKSSSTAVDIFRRSRRVEPQSGQDIVITIDLDLQKTAEDQLRKSPQGRGVIISMDPNSGEFGVASAPLSIPIFFRSASPKEGQAEYQKRSTIPITLSSIGRFQGSTRRDRPGNP
jgi:cell division protein FtsI/penicillin-binding protein 2